VTDATPNSYTSFNGHRRLTSGPLQAIALAVKRALEAGADGPVLIFDDATGRSIDIDTRGSDAEVTARFAHAAAPEDRGEADAGPRGRGRPKLGVVPREVTLLPRHWEWLAQQPGGASVALRKLVEEARRAQGGPDQRRRMQERAYHFITAMAGDLPGFEEATRALFANDRARFSKLTASWPDDIRDQAEQYAFGAGDRPAPSKKLKQ
jgi:uncharacterized protein